jgi:hypothetical protein
MTTERGAMAGRPRRLNEPVPADVRLGPDGRPARVAWRVPRDGRRSASPRFEPVECVLDTWCVDDAWWSERPVRRLYHEVQLVSGVRLVLSWDLLANRWLAQR